LLLSEVPAKALQRLYSILRNLFCTQLFCPGQPYQIGDRLSRQIQRFTKGDQWSIRMYFVKNSLTELFRRTTDSAGIYFSRVVVFGIQPNSIISRTGNDSSQSLFTFWICSICWR
jgi:hypothetical protein